MVARYKIGTMIDLDKIKLKKQRHVWSCGLACVAMVAKQAYNNVIDDYWDQESDEIYWKWIEERKTWQLGYGTTTKDLHNLLDGYGIETNKRCVPYKGSDKLPDLSILVVMKRKEVQNGRKETCWHWVVCKREGRKFKVLDPWYGERTLKDCGKINSFIRIHT